MLKYSQAIRAFSETHKLTKKREEAIKAGWMEIMEMIHEISGASMIDANAGCASDIKETLRDIHPRIEYFHNENVIMALSEMCITLRKILENQTYNGHKLLDAHFFCQFVRKH